MQTRAPAPGQLISRVAQTMAEMAAGARQVTAHQSILYSSGKRAISRGMRTISPSVQEGMVFEKHSSLPPPRRQSGSNDLHFTIGKTETQGSCAFAQGYQPSREGRS